jgi:5-carboxymethyl-2-hydroxymuconate isomerase
VPHIIVEYSDNLDLHISRAALLAAVHEAALTQPIIPADGLRTRAEPRSDYVIADGHPDNVFVAVVARLGPGRTPEEKHSLLDALLAAVENVLGTHANNVMLSVEYQEIDAEFRINKNNLRSTIENRSKP